MAKTVKPTSEESSGEERTEILPADVAELYTIRDGLLWNFVCSEFGEVNLKTVNLEFASRLAEAGYLIKKNA